MPVLTPDEAIQHGVVLDPLDIDSQIQTNGIDLTVADIAHPISQGVVSKTGTVPAKDVPVYDEDGITHLPQGAYIVTFGQRIQLPPNVMAYLRPRSSLLRCGVALHTGVWDAGYRGRGKALLTVHNPQGFGLEIGARIAQMVFHTLDRQIPEEDLYDGQWQDESLDVLQYWDKNRHSRSSL